MTPPYGKDNVNAILFFCRNHSGFRPSILHGEGVESNLFFYLVSVQHPSISVMLSPPKPLVCVCLGGWGGGGGIFCYMTSLYGEVVQGPVLPSVRLSLMLLVTLARREGISMARQQLRILVKYFRTTLVRS